MANGPGGQEVGRISVRVVPDTSRFAVDLKKKLERIEKTRAAEIKVRAVLDDKQLRADVRKMASELGLRPINIGTAEIDKTGSTARIRSQLLDVTRSATRGMFIRLPVMALNLGTTSATIAGFVGLLGSATAALYGLGAAAAATLPSLALIPAALAGGAAAIGVLITGFRGMKDALSAADPAEFQKALDNLAPSAQDAALEMRALGPALKELRFDIQQRLWEGWGLAIHRIGQEYLPVFRAGLVGIAGALNRVGRDISDFYLQARTVQSTGVLFENVSAAISASSLGIKGFLSGLTDIGTVASGILPDLARGFTELGDRFAQSMAEMRESGALDRAIRNALDMLNRIFSVLVDIGSIMKSIGGAAFDAFGSSIERTADSMARFLQSAQGVRMLNQVFGGLAAVMNGISPIVSEIGRTFVEYLAPAIQRTGVLFGQAFRNMAPAVDPLMKALSDILPILGRVAVAVSQTLSNALQRLAPHLAPLADMFADVLIAALPLVDVFVEIADQLLTALAPVLPELVAAFQNLVSAIAPIVEQLAPVFVEMIKSIVQILPPLINLFAELAPVIGAVAALLGGMITVLAKVAEGIIWVVDQLATGIAGKGGLADSLIPALRKVKGETEDLAYTGEEFLRDWRQALDQAVDKAKVFQGEVGSAMHQAGVGVGFFSNAVAARTQRAQEYLQAHIAYISSIFSPRVRNAARAAGNGFTSYRDGARARMEEAKQYLAASINQIKRILNPDRGSFWNSGFALGSSFADGIEASVGRVGAAASRLAGAAGAFLPNSPAEKGPFSGTGWTPYRGRALAEGFAEGITAGSPRVVMATTRMADALSQALDTQVGSKVNVGSKIVDSIREATPEAERALEALASGSHSVGAEWKRVVESDDFSGLPDKIAEAVGNMRVDMDGQKVARITRKHNSADSRRGR